MVPAGLRAAEISCEYASLESEADRHGCQEPDLGPSARRQGSDLARRRPSPGLSSRRHDAPPRLLAAPPLTGREELERRAAVHTSSRQTKPSNPKAK